MTAPQQRVDGRTARSTRTRNAIVDAHVRLILDGDLRPTADRIARTAGVSLRALWSHFTDMEALFAASGQRILDLRDNGHDPIPPDLPLEQRIDLFCRQRARMLEQIAPVARASAIKEPFSPILQHHRLLYLERIREEIRVLFASEVDGDPDLLTALVAVSLWPTWGTWRDSMGLSAEAAGVAFTRTITALLSRPGGNRDGKLAGIRPEADHAASC